ncbi:hypothetical protein VKT23_013796 [Stygiomarasmius scandens]|uniref:Uncharacterized protein n=1 Tax=Marasmiellus scandens TaxID=2682957 RepID=A0ABR1J2L6_9AGAR
MSVSRVVKKSYSEVRKDLLSKAQKDQLTTAGNAIIGMELQVKLLTDIIELMAPLANHAEGVYIQLEKAVTLGVALNFSGPEFSVLKDSFNKSKAIFESQSDTHQSSAVASPSTQDLAEGNLSGNVIADQDTEMLDIEGSDGDDDLEIIVKPTPKIPKSIKFKKITKAEANVASPSAKGKEVAVSASVPTLIRLLELRRKIMPSFVTSKAAEASGSGAKRRCTEFGSAKAADTSVMHFSDEGAKFSTAGAAMAIQNSYSDGIVQQA